MIVNLVDGLSPEQMYEIISNQHLQNPWIFSNEHIGTKMSLTKLFSKNAAMTSWRFEFAPKRHLVSRMIVYIGMDSWPRNFTNFTSNDIVLLISNQGLFGKTRNEAIFDAIRIDQQIYILEPIADDNWMLIEGYFINGYRIVHYLGAYRPINDKKVSFLPNKQYSSKFEVRRSDFMGSHIRAVAEREVQFLRIEDGYQKNYFPKNDTYDVTDFYFTMDGFYNDAMATMKKTLNFTLSIYKRGDETWGVRNVDENGTVTFSGMVGDLVYGRADIVAAPLTVTSERSTGIDFLPGLSQSVPAIFIKNNLQEAIDWKLLFSPWRIELWVIIVLTASLLALALTFMDLHHSPKIVTGNPKVI